MHFNWWTDYDVTYMLCGVKRMLLSKPAYYLLHCMIRDTRLLDFKLGQDKHTWHQAVREGG